MLLKRAATAISLGCAAGAGVSSLALSQSISATYVFESRSISGQGFAHSDSAGGYSRSETYKLSNLPTNSVGGATLSITAQGDLNSSNENIRVTLLGSPEGGPAEYVVFGADGPAGNACLSPVTATVSIDAETTAKLVGDGSMTVEIAISDSVTALADASSDSAAASLAACEALGATTAAVVSGTLTYTSEDPTDPTDEVDPGEENETPDMAAQTAWVAQSITASRTSVTMSNLPSLSGRMSGGNGSATVSGSGGSSSGALAFSADLQGLFAAASLSETDAAAFDGPSRLPIDFWIGGSFSYFETTAGEVDQDGGVGTLQMGVDGRVADGFLIGFLAAGDLLESNASTGSDTTGLGFLSGPYAVMSLTDGVYLEGLATVGRAYNTIEADNQPDVEFESDRLLLSARLAGDWRLGDWSVRPSSRVTYYAEKQEAFEAADGSEVEEDTSILGQLRFGPEISHRFAWDEGSAQPFIGAEGVWGFMNSETVINGVTIAPDEFSGSVSLGVDALIGGAAIRAGGRYDGVGSDNLETLTGELSVRIPLD